MLSYKTEILPGDAQILLVTRIKELRKQQKITQSQLAEKSNVSLGSIKRFERTGQISLKALLRIIHVLGRLTEIQSLLLPIEDLSEIEKLFSEKMRNQ